MIVAVTFGTEHTHKIQDMGGKNIVIDHSTIALIECDNISEARDRIFNSSIGDRFCTTYDLSSVQRFRGMSGYSLVQIDI